MKKLRSMDGDLCNFKGAKDPCVCDRGTVVLPVHLYSLWIRRISLALSPVFFHIGPITTPVFLACRVGDTPSCKKMASDEIRNIIILDDPTVVNVKVKVKSSL
jgi:hypothetical protein